MNDLFGIYVHWPFCKSKCPYCDFNSHVNDSIDHEIWRQSYKKEIEYIAGLTKGRKVSSVFFGGGTPSLMEPKTVEVILDSISEYWDVSNNIEITLEANPTSIEAQKFKDFKAAGINRVSIGVQSLNDNDLKFLGREHSADEAIQALKIANNIFDRFSFDLIYARPDQKINEWRDELKEALKYAKGHMSAYQLTIEQGTPFYIQHRRGDFKIPEENLAANLYEVTQDAMGAHTMPAYEVSNHAIKGQESLHNLIYWRYGDYAGIGPGAHGRLTLDKAKTATRTHRAPDVWLQKTNEFGHGYHLFEEINAQERLVECFMMGLRLREGILKEKLEKEGSKKFDDIFSLDKIKALQEEGLIIIDKDRIMPTDRGLQRLNAIFSYLL